MEENKNLKHAPEFRSKREEERAELKNTAGYKLWSVMFTLLYPFIAIFTFIFSGVVMFFSGISRVLAYLFGGFHVKR
jgi:cellulose synthase/poly-beta-1,6-N-acetylglucosamine synthase-like glycosyltransferase